MYEWAEWAGWKDGHVFWYLSPNRSRPLISLRPIYLFIIIARVEVVWSLELDSISNWTKRKSVRYIQVGDARLKRSTVCAHSIRQRL